MTAAIVNLVGEQAIEIGTDIILDIDVDDTEVDLTGTPIAEIRKIPVSVLPNAVFVATVDQELRRLKLVLTRLESGRLIAGLHTWRILMAYAPTEQRPDGWHEYLLGGRLEAVLR